jgi:hypothetical protein
VEPVQAARALGAVGDEAGLLEQAQVSRDGRAADRQGVGELLDRAVAAAGEQLDDRAAMGVAERVERVSGQRVEADWRNGSRNVTVAT